MTFTPENAIVWFELPVSDLEGATGFYESVLQTKLIDENMGAGPVKIFPTQDEAGAGGNLFESDAKPSTATVIHFASPGKLEDTLARVKSSGGDVMSDIVELPAGRFAYCLDPDGNSIGVFSR